MASYALTDGVRTPIDLVYKRADQRVSDAPWRHFAHPLVLVYAAGNICMVNLFRAVAAQEVDLLKPPTIDLR
jgi:hypothetical protein